MNVCDIDQSFTILNKGGGILYFKGSTNYSPDKLYDTLYQDNIPVDIRGNFCFIWIDKNNQCTAFVDHFCTYNIFYTDSNIGSYFYEVASTTNKTTNQFGIEQKILLGGWTVGEQTVFKEVERIPPGHYLRNKKLVRYVDVFDVEPRTPDQVNIEEFRHIFTNAIEKDIKDKNVLYLSGGKDSMTLAAVINNSHFKDKFRYITVVSDSQFYSERSVVQRVSEDLGINVDYISVEASGANNEYDSNRYESFVQEDTFLAKKDAYNQLGDKYIAFTGEMGLGHQQATGHLRLLSQMKTLDARTLAEFSVNIAASYHKFVGYDIDHNAHVQCQGIDRNNYTYQFLVDYFSKRFETLKDPNPFNRCIHINLVEETMHRLYGYSQDNNDVWRHPFTEFDLISYLISLPLEFKLKNGVDKLEFQYFFSDIISYIPWEYPKSGLSIPTYKKFRQYSNR